MATAVAITANVIFYYILTRWLKIDLMFPSETLVAIHIVGAIAVVGVLVRQASKS